MKRRIAGLVLVALLLACWTSGAWAAGPSETGSAVAALEALAGSKDLLADRGLLPPVPLSAIGLR